MGFEQVEQRTLISFWFNSGPPGCFEVPNVGKIAPPVLSEQFLLGDETSEEAWSTMGRMHFGSMELEFSIFSFPLKKQTID